MPLHKSGASPGQPDLFLRDGGEGLQAGELAKARQEGGQGRGVGHCLTHTRFAARDKPGYHVLTQADLMGKA
jgi:hypothetical protein